MRPELSAFRSRVGKRNFVLFVPCALVPITTLGLVCFDRVSAQRRGLGALDPMVIQPSCA
jgi:hypothetical protein